MKQKFLNYAMLMTAATFMVACGGGQKKAGSGSTSADAAKDSTYWAQKLATYKLPEGAIPVEDFLKNSEKSGYQISPDGKHFSYMSPVNQRKNVFVQEIGKTEATQITHETERDVAGYFWKNNNRIVFLKDVGGDENYQLHAVDIDGSNPKALTPFPKVRTQVFDDLPDNENEMIIGLNKRNPMVFDAYRINVTTGDTTLLLKNPGNVQGYMTDNDGIIRIEYVLDGMTVKMMYRDNEKQDFKEIYSGNYRDSFEPYGFTADNKHLYMGSNIGRDKTALIEYDPSTQKEVKMIYENPKYDISGLIYSRKDKKLQGVGYMEHGGVGRYIIDAKYKALREKLEAKLGTKRCGVADMNKNEDKFIVVKYNDLSRGTYYYYDATKNELTKIADLSPWIDESKMCPMNCVTYTTRDGLEIEAYLTLPNGLTMETAKNLPVVVNPHGGPWARDDWGYNPEVQLFANRGYAVLQMNFRGSTGFGRKFWELSFKQWGQTMQNDITDGVNWLIEKGIADKSKVAIYGGSYGGYATLAGITNTPDVYACAVDYVGVSNLFTFMKTVPAYWKPMLDMMHDMVGDPSNQQDSLMMVANSPVMNVDKIKCPLFIAQGANDPRVNKDESDQMVAALKKRGIDVEYMVKYNEGHGFHNEENRFDFYKAMDMFLAEHLKK